MPTSQVGGIENMQPQSAGGGKVSPLQILAQAVCFSRQSGSHDVLLSRTSAALACAASSGQS